MNIQQGDVKLFQTTDDGDISVVGGITEMSSGLGTAVYLSMFGGNEHDPGGDDTRNQYWGNITEIDSSKRYRSETQHLLSALPLNTGNILKIEKAIGRDLQWMLDVGTVTSIEISTGIPQINKIKIDITVISEGKEQTITFTENWKASVL